MASRIVQYFADKLKTVKEYPITLTKAVYDENGKRLDNKLQEIDNSISDANSNLTQNYDLITKSKKIFTSKTDDFGIISTGLKITEAIPLFVFDGASNYACTKLHVYDNTVYATFVNTYTNAIAKQTQITVTTYYLPIK